MKKRFLSKITALTLSSTMIASNTIVVRADVTNSSFTDVDTSRWSAPYIESFYEKGYISGYPDGTFKPKEYITRAEVSAIFAKVGIDETKEGIQFKDVSQDDWYYSDIDTVTKIGLASGYPDGTFKPNNLLTRNEAFKVCATTFKNTDVSSISPDFVDQNSVAEWAEVYEKHLIYYDVLGGFPDNSVKGDANITREEFVKLLFHIVNDENVSETIKENIISWDNYYEQLNKNEQTDEIIPPVVTPVVTPKPSEKPSTSGGGNSDSSDDSENNVIAISRVPALNAIISGDKAVSGTGVSGSIITVIMPNGKTYTTTVGTDNKWSVSITETLSKDDVIKATQTESGKTVSATVTTIVSAKSVSANPFINAFIEGAETISGTGISGSTITVTMPNGKTYTTTVGTDNKWSISITETLSKGDVIEATQTESGKTVSDTVRVTVSPKPVSTNPSINDFTEGDKTIFGTGISGSTITVTMPNSNTYTATVGTDNKWSVSITETLSKGDVIEATQTESGKGVSETAKTTVKELILLDVKRASSIPEEELGQAPNIAMSSYPYYEPNKLVVSDEIVLTLNDNYSNTTVEYYKLTTEDKNNYTVDEPPTDTTPIDISFTDGKGRITGLANGDKYVIMSTGEYNGEQKSTIYTIVIDNIRDGSKEKPLAIYDKDTLRSITEGSTLYYDQTNDIDLENEWEENIANQFNGSYYGNNYKIKNLSGTHGFFGNITNATIDGMNIQINDCDADGVVPFGIISNSAQNAELSNITVTLDGTMNTERQSGLVVGVLLGGKATHIVVNINGKIIANGESVGGFAGQITRAYSTAVLDDITVNIAEGGKIESTGINVGGICGAAMNNMTATNLTVENKGHIKSARTAGAAFGRIEIGSSATNVTIVNSDTSLIECVDADTGDYDTTVGGFAGIVDTSTISNINVTNKGRIIGSEEVGGIFGWIKSSTVSKYSHTGLGNTIVGITNVGNYYGLNESSTFEDPEITTDMNDVKP